MNCLEEASGCGEKLITLEINFKSIDIPDVSLFGALSLDIKPLSGSNSKHHIFDGLV